MSALMYQEPAFPGPAPCPDAFSDEAVMALLNVHSYETVHEKTGWSRGRIYRLALRTGARKTESRIQQRKANRRREQEELLRSMLDSTAKADVLDFLAGLPDNSVDCHFTSPPFNVGKRYGDDAATDTMRFVYYMGWLLQVVSELARTVKPGGVVCLEVGKTPDWTGSLVPLDSMLIDPMQKAGLKFQNRVMWTIPHGLTPAHRLADRHETVLIFSKGPIASFNPNAARIPQKQPGKRAFKGPNKGELSGNPLGAWPTDVWSDIPTVRYNHPERAMGAHPAQFPVNLAKRAILLYTLPGATICDCFAGSGSTAIAAIEAGRHFIGADLFYEDLRERRIAAAKPDTVTPLTGVTDESVAVWQAEARRVDLRAEPISAADEAAQQAALFPEG